MHLKRKWIGGLQIDLLQPTGWQIVPNEPTLRTSPAEAGAQERRP